VIDEFLKDKRKIGIVIVLVIVIVSAGILYGFSGFKELKNNNTENIFVENESEEIEEPASENYKNNTTAINKKKEDEKKITVEIKGEVKKPDVYVLEENSIVKDLIEKAGGLTENADISSVNRAKQLQNHELVYISNKNDDTSISEGNNNVKQVVNAQSNNMININFASVDDLKKLNGIGESKANSIIEYREKNGAFKSIEDIKNVDGIGEKMFQKIKDSISV